MNKKNVIKKNAKGQGHVEVMISFVLFISVLIFFFIFLNPFAKAENKVYYLESVQEVIFKNISEEINKLSIITEGNSTCYDFDEQDYGTNYVEVKTNERKYNIYFSKEIPGSFEKSAPNKLLNCSTTNYSLGLYTSEKIFIYEKIEELKNAYSEYTLLKSNMGINRDFSFNVRKIDNARIDELSVEKVPPTGVSVESKDIPIRVINKTGDIQELILNLRVW